MLVLTRKVGEGIAIGEEIKIVVMQIKGKQVRLGIKASADTVVHREEVFQRIQEENRRASSSCAEGLAEMGGVFSAGVDKPAKPVLRAARRKPPKVN